MGRFGMKLQPSFTTTNERLLQSTLVPSFSPADQITDPLGQGEAIELQEAYNSSDTKNVTQNSSS